MAVLNQFLFSIPYLTPFPKTGERVNIITLGCDKNRVDSEQLAAQLKAVGYHVSLDAAEPCPITLVNTCGFINDAKLQSIETILTCIAEKKKGNILLLVVFGCLSQRYREELSAEMPEVDSWLGVNALQPILSLLHKEIRPHLLTRRILSTPSHYAYLKISEGCNHGCAFCAIPLIKGRHTSKPMEKVLEEARILAGNGVKELILVAQDLTSYGIDLYRKQELARLLEGLAAIPQLKWIRLHYAYPNSFPTGILDVICEHPNICHYLDIPIQHIDDGILKAMNRRLTEAEIRSLLETIRTRIPDIALRTSLIVGFPGETPKKFQKLLSFVEEFRFDRLGVFSYSHEDNTPAYRLNDRISQAEKERRKEALLWSQQQISLEKNRARIGQQLQVLIDSRTASHYIGRTQYDSPEVDNSVIISRRNNRCEIGEMYPVRLTRAKEFDLYGKIITD